MPGPNVALIVVDSATYGVRHGLVTVLGAFGGLVLQVLAVLCGLAALLAGLGHWFTLLRWLGVAYLLWLGIRQWRAPSQDLSRVRPEPPGRAHTPRQAFLVSCANPKIMLFLGALFPQFISAAHPAQPQILVLGAQIPCSFWARSIALGRCSPPVRGGCFRAGAGYARGSRAGS